MLTYNSLERASRVLAYSILEAGVRKGDRVVLMFDNCIEFVVGYFASLRLQTIAIPLSPRDEPIKVRHVIDHAQPKIALHAGQLMESFGALPTLHVDFDALLSANAPDIDDIRFSGEEIIALLYTSGTTGNPKGAALRWGHFVENITDYGNDLRVDQVTRFIVTMPMSHIDGWTYSTLQPFLFGASATIAPLFDAHVAATFPRFIDPDSNNVLIAVPAMLSALLAMRRRADWPVERTLGYVICGSSRLTPELKKTFEEEFQADVLENYGSTEALLVAYYSHNTPYRPGSVGRVPPKCQVRIMANGEIGVSGAYVFQDYFRDPERTAAAFEDGCYLIGDLGTVDSDGYLYLYGRRQDTINKAGIKIDPAEIDKVIAAHPAVLESVTLGVDNTLQSQDIFSFVHLRHPASDLQAYVQGKLPQVKWPAKILPVEYIPKTPLGKVIKTELLKQIAQSTNRDGAQ